VTFVSRDRQSLLPSLRPFTRFPLSTLTSRLHTSSVMCLLEMSTRLSPANVGFKTDGRSSDFFTRWRSKSRTTHPFWTIHAERESISSSSPFRAFLCGSCASLSHMFPFHAVKKCDEKFTPLKNFPHAVKRTGLSFFVHLTSSPCGTISEGAAAKIIVFCPKRSLFFFGFVLAAAVPGLRARGRENFFLSPPSPPLPTALAQQQ